MNTIIISSRILDDIHDQWIMAAMKKFGLKTFYLNIHSDCSKLNYGLSNNDVFVSLGKQKIKDPVFYISAPLRTYSTLMIGVDCEYPSLYRNCLSDFIDDLGYLSENCWYPASPTQSRRANSKILLYKIAAEIGMSVPLFTTNSFRNISPANESFRKSLSFPFMVSNKKGSHEEVFLTLHNHKSSKGEENIGIPWQWQECISASHHVRCHIAGDKIWAVSSSIIPLKDLRSYSDEEFEKLEWKEFIFDSTMSRMIFQLLHDMRVKFASPEFLLDENGKMILIDFNPCGDWIGFFPKKISRQICSKHAELIATTN